MMKSARFHMKSTGFHHEICQISHEIHTEYMKSAKWAKDPWSYFLKIIAGAMKFESK